MKHFPRYVLGCAAAACIGIQQSALSQTFPAKPMRMIMALAGGSEGFARLVAQKMTEDFGQPVLVETQAGAGGAIGASMVARSAPDGYTILYAATNSQVYHKFLSKSTLYDPIRDFTAITKIGEAVLCIISNPAAPFASFKEMIDYAKRNPGKLSFGTSGIGTTHHLAAELIKQITGVDMVHVPYKSGGQLLTGVISGQVPVGFGILATATSQLKSGKLRVFAVVNDWRYHGIPDIATVRELLPGFEQPPGWMGFLGPAALPAPVLGRLHGELVKVLNLPEMRTKSEDFGFVLGTSNSPEEFATALKRDLDTVGRIVKAAGIQPE
jgi:tripartite-type tricarboxylate transporter receptor subunit TctC